jgi:hypothetical protein
LPELHRLCNLHRGNCPVYFELTSPAGWTALVKARANGGVNPSERFVEEVAALPGVQGVVCCGPRGAVGHA